MRFHMSQQFTRLFKNTAACCTCWFTFWMEIVNVTSEFLHRNKPEGTARKFAVTIEQVCWGVFMAEIGVILKKYMLFAVKSWIIFKLNEFLEVTTKIYLETAKRLGFGCVAEVAGEFLLPRLFLGQNLVLGRFWTTSLDGTHSIYYK